jgi:predicted TIM-barrel fold metal-dependent hydrolase
MKIPVKIIDTHQHLWHKDLFHYAWLESLPKLNRSFRLSDYQEATRGLEIEKTVFVECDVNDEQVEDEALHILRLAEQPGSRIAGVVASGRPEKDGFESRLERLRCQPRLKGIRRILHTHADELGRGKTFIENVRKLEDYGLSFDICVLARQLPIAINLVSQCPGVTFILDHCGVPQVKERVMHPWREHIQEIASFPNVYCKVSGLVVYADPVNWKPEDLGPFVDHVLESFGWDRVMFGSDWPVCTLAASYRQWVEALLSLTQAAGETNQRKLFHDNAIRAYRLS